MLKVHTLPLGDYQTNCYLVHPEDGASCVVIDPGYSPEAVLRYAEGQGLTIEAILLTHGHFDHVGGVKVLAAEAECPVYLHEAELSMPPMMTAGKLCYTHLYGEGDTLDLAGMTIQVLHTPGHTPGSVCLKTGDILFSGDTLFAGSCGRTDLPGGDWAAIQKSLGRLAGLPGDCHVLPGHGESTTLARERKYNPYMR